MTTFLLLNGPNLNRLGLREPEIYGNVTLEQIENRMATLGQKMGVEVIAKQSNHEGELIEAIHLAADQGWQGVIFNPAAYTHSSIALRDAISSVNVPVIELHISNVHARESFRHTSVLSAVSAGQIVGFGVYGYELAFYALNEIVKGGKENE
ncbi:type II 3-dehydroquinate dehydratase [Jeotgalibacillus sp. S-D1]|uniref:type II 3-dehydroquinate dehydratase n=1 Tax=Jeotgalibacillus sp. S-D1 TaxID=2552189 RepID=UPI00105A6A47|nr:type II 3-dehydroquinate dehydratase [Jeotgalibacillus sp. S-D1]TDL34614.1 type II 3-dehydroquinate dehydratase [Jeotgalibacillus sp. S-D1]